MKAEELRLNNYVTASYMYSKTLTVVGLNSTHCEFYDIADKFLSSSIYPYIQPIELTEEWLLKFGFTCDLYESDCGHSFEYHSKGLFTLKLLACISFTSKLLKLLK